MEDKILFKKSSNFSKPLAQLKKGRMLILKSCENNWCKITTDTYSGWIINNNIWGSTK
ncbi:SH3 domain-containing protein [Pelagibacteraceae bacterium]|nr:SH3 domain-containing protein [Pelagibacteraceae bacterium]